MLGLVNCFDSSSFCWKILGGMLTASALIRLDLVARSGMQVRVFAYSLPNHALFFIERLLVVVFGRKRFRLIRVNRSSQYVLMLCAVF